MWLMNSCGDKLLNLSWISYRHVMIAVNVEAWQMVNVGCIGHDSGVDGQSKHQLRPNHTVSW